MIKSPTLDYYLVLTGPKGALAPSKGMLRPFCIASVYLFQSQDLLAARSDWGQSWCCNQCSGCPVECSGDLSQCDEPGAYPDRQTESAVGDVPF